jgi:predicted O-methyltransferase YrrM
LPMPMPSSMACKIVEPAQLIYIDGSHEYEDVKADCRNYWPLLQEGGVMFGDDFDWPTVAQAVREEFPHVEAGEFFWQVRK